MYLIHTNVKMDVELSVLCYGCLCADRKLILLQDYLTKQCFQQIINEIPFTHPEDLPIWLCFECTALVCRFSKFKQLVYNSYKVLQENVKKNIKKINTSQLTYKTKLQTHKLYNITLTTKTESDETIIFEVIKPIKQEIDIKEEVDNTSLTSDYDDDTLLIEYSSKKKRSHKNSINIKSEAVAESDDCNRKRRRKKKDRVEEVYKEIELTREELEEERRVLMMRDEFVNAMFKCEKCIISFTNIDDLNDHVTIKHDLNASLFKCKVCDCSFASEVSYNYHTNKHKRRYQCVDCMDRFQSKRSVLKHIEFTHQSIDMNYELYKIPHSNSKFEESNQEDNDTKQNGATFPCHYCDKIFRWKTSLRKHIETHKIETGQKRKPYCEPCRLSFTTTSNLQKHVKTSSKHQIQLKLRKLKESLPEDATNEKQQARIDQIKCSVNNARQQYPCSQCDKKFQWRGNLLRHQHSHAARANGELICTPCNRTFSSIATYKQHMKISKKHVTENDFKYMCSDCGKRFANKTRLKDHVDWEHLKNYTHICPHCQKVFKSHTSLYLHKQVVHKKHNAEHLCDHCGKAFPNHAKLRSHIIALHTTESPYKCNSCSARFSWHSCLSRHVRRVHRSQTNKRKKNNENNIE